jgi:hypothetical protein
MEGPTSKKTNEPPKRVNHKENMKILNKHNGRLCRSLGWGHTKNMGPTWSSKFQPSPNKLSPMIQNFSDREKKGSYEFTKCSNKRCKPSNFHYYKNQRKEFNKLWKLWTSTFFIKKNNSSVTHMRRVFVKKLHQSCQTFEELFQNVSINNKNLQYFIIESANRESQEVEVQYESI